MPDLIRYPENPKPKNVEHRTPNFERRMRHPAVFHTIKPYLTDRINDR